MTWRLPFEALNPWQVENWRMASFQCHQQLHRLTHLSGSAHCEAVQRRVLKLCALVTSQIMVAVDRGERPETPPGHRLLGGGFVGLPHYQRLMRACWAALPHERPPVEEVPSRPSQTSNQSQTKTFRY
jgi:hypothetical protein